MANRPVRTMIVRAGGSTVEVELDSSKPFANKDHHYTLTGVEGSALHSLPNPRGIIEACLNR
jgi:hypothetical protein